MAHPVVLSDASPLIALALIDRLNLLHSLFGEVLITEVVKGEILVGGDKPGETAIEATGSASLRTSGPNHNSPTWTKARRAPCALPSTLACLVWS
jgi:hypothetical protein